MPTINNLVVDLSHYDPATDYYQVKQAGIIGVIYKATQGQSFRDSTCAAQRTAALSAGLLWGAYHFGDATDPVGQAHNFLGFAQIDAATMFCLDYEPNGNSTMTVSQAKQFIEEVETQLSRPNECVLYSGNLIKDNLGSIVDPFFGARRLWLAQYGDSPTVQASWQTYWLWQYTDGTCGPKPWVVPGIGPCDCNSFQGTPQDLVTQWPSGTIIPPVPPAPSPDIQTITITITAPAATKINIVSNP